ncbi:hypothetical protein J31TS3_36620 [Paenibacillus lactis]|nr:hypothetical protein J31TS3_36620 [Paenibacillus lactis]
MFSIRSPEQMKILLGVKRVFRRTGLTILQCGRAYERESSHRNAWSH